MDMQSYIRLEEDAETIVDLEDYPLRAWASPVLAL